MIIHRYTVITLLLLCKSSLSYSQNLTSFKVEDKKIKTVYFIAHQVSTIILNTNPKPIYHFSSKSEGSYETEFQFDYFIKKDSLIIHSIYPKKLEFGDNKMTAMQSFSVNVDLTIPEKSRLIIESDIASVYGQGNFIYFRLNTKAGNCMLSPFIGDASINTYSGNIVLHTNKSLVKAESQNGKTTIEKINPIQNSVHLKTVNGDIEVKKLE